MRFTGGTTQKSGVRPPAVAGRFYPGGARELAAEVDAHVAAARAALASQVRSADGTRLVAVVVPHAGYVYSGATAGFGFAQLPATIRRVVLFGPAHYVPVVGLGLSSAAAWRTPLGEVAIDAAAAADLAADFDFLTWEDRALAPEHSLEVQVPFLQRVLDPGWQLLPMIVGQPSAEQVARVIGWAARQPDTVVVISTDLSHYLPYEQARTVDARTLGNIAAAHAAGIADSDACGAYGLRGLLHAAATAGWQLQQLDARNSGDTAGSRDRVVGYCAFACWAGSADHDVARPGSAAAASLPATDLGQIGDLGAVADSAMLPAGARRDLLGLARGVITAALAGAPRPDWRVVAAAWPVCSADGAAFVTLRSAAGDLLGCIGSLTPTQPLACDVAAHAYDAAFRDPRFSPMTSERARGMIIDISVLGPTRPFPVASYDNLLAALRPGVGLVVAAPRHRATFLPAVWETLPDAASFIAALWRKAGLAPGAWPRGIAISRYDVQEFAES